MNIKPLEELFNLEQQLDIPMKHRFHKTLTDEQISILTAPKGSYPASPVKEDAKSDNEILFEKLEKLKT
jgi:hypothetical protein